MDPPASVRTVDDALQHIGFGRFQTILLLCAGLAYFGDAVEVMLLSYLGPTLRCEWQLGPEAESWLTSVVFAGMMLGSALWSAVSDLHGRKVAVASMGLFTAVFGLLSAASPTFQVVLLTRFFVGMGLAGVPAVFTLLMEYVPPRSRGFWMTFIESFWTLGTAVEALLAAAILPIHGWRMLLVVSALPLVVLVILSPALHESARYFLTTGRVGEAERLLLVAAKLNGKTARLPPLDLQLLPHPTSTKPRSPIPTPSPSSPSTTPGSPDAGGDLTHQPLLVHSPRNPIPVHHPPSRAHHGQHPTTTPLIHPSTLPLHHPSPLPHPPLNASSPLGNRGQGSRPTPPLPPLVILRATLQRAWHQVRRVALTVSGLFRGHLQRRTSLLMLVWFTNGLAYYAVVLLSTSLVAGKQGAQGGGARELECKDGRAPFTRSDFMSILVTAAAEIPSIAFAATVVDCLGRRWSMVLSLFLTSAALAPMAAGLASTLAVQTFLLFIARLFIMASFTILWVYTPELYPAYVRTLGLGVNNSVARIGGIVAPFLAVGLVRRGAEHSAEGIIVLLCGIAAVAVWALGIEPAGMALDQGAAEACSGEGHARVQGPEEL